MGASSIFAWLKLQLQKLWCGISRQESTPDLQCPPWLELTPTPALILDEILFNPSNRALCNFCYHRLLDMFEAGNKTCAPQETRLRSLEALLCLIELSQHPQAGPFAPRAMNYLKYCYSHGEDSQRHRLFADTLATIHHHITPEPTPVAGDNSRIFLSFSGAAGVKRSPDSNLFLDQSPAKLFDMATDPGICQSSQRMAFESLLRLFEMGNSLSATPAETATSIDAINLINQIAQAPERSPCAWEATLYLANCYNYGADGANNPLTEATQRDLKLLLTLAKSRQAINHPKP